jgi:hypothetical protein
VSARISPSRRPAGGFGKLVAQLAVDEGAERDTFCSS